MEDEVVVGHVLRRISAICHLFLRRGGHIVCQITGPRQFSLDLPQGGLEVPCSLTIIGDDKEVHKSQEVN